MVYVHIDDIEILKLTIKKTMRLGHYLLIK